MRLLNYRDGNPRVQGNIGRLHRGCIEKSQKYCPVILILPEGINAWLLMKFTVLLNGKIYFRYFNTLIKHNHVTFLY